MLSQPEPRRRLGSLVAILALMLGAALTVSVAMAGVSSGNRAAPLPYNQDPGKGVPKPEKQPEDPVKGPERTSPPSVVNTQGGVQSGAQEPSGFICGPGSVYFDEEPNNTIATAQPITSTNRAEVRGAIDSAGDADYYSFQANAGDRVWAYAFTLGATSSTDSQLTLLDALTQTIQLDEDNGSQSDLSSAIAGAVITQTATYYLKVSAFSSTSTIFNYTLFIDRTSTAPIAEVEPNNSFSQTNPYTMGSVVAGSIPVTTDMDVYTFEFLDDRRYIFQVDGDPERDGIEFNPNFDLMNTSGAVLVTVDSDSQFDAREITSESAAFFIDTGGPPTGTLLLRVRADGTSTGTYNLHIWETGTTFCNNTPTPTATATSTPVCNTFVSEVEPNNTITNSQLLPTLDNLEVRAPINPPGDIDYFEGTATAGSKVWAYVFTAASNSGADSELRLLNAVSNTIQYDDDNGSQTAASSGIAGAPVTTTMQVHFRVNEFNNDGTITPYVLFIDLTSSAPNVAEVEPNDVYTQANMVAIGDLITGTIPITTDLDVYGFTVNAGDRIIFQADGDPERDGVQYNPSFQILDSTGAQLVAVDSDSALGDRRSEHHAFTFGAAGTYYVRMSSDESGPDTGSYNLHLWRTADPPCSATATPSATNTTVPPTATSTSTSTAVPTNTSTAVPTDSPTAVPSSTSTAVPTNTSTAVPTNTSTAVPSSTSTSVPGSTATTVPSSTPPPTATGVPTLTSTPIPTATLCAVQFTDVTPANPFYSYIRCLACRGIVSGYADGTFRPYNNMTRGQLAKVVSNSAGFSEPVPAGQQRFEDVPPSDTFFVFVERVAARGIISGYDCGTAPAGPCVPPGNRPYFRPYSDVLRGQLAKIVAMTADIKDPVPPGRQTFEDVTGDNPFYLWIEQLAGRGIMSGWDCGAAPAGRCVAPANRPYFLPFEETTRAQVSKVVALAFFPNCAPPAAGDRKRD